MIFSIVSALVFDMCFDRFLDRFWLIFGLFSHHLSMTCRLCFRMFFRMMFLMVLGTQGGPKRTLKGVPNRSKIGPKSSSPPTYNFDPFWVDLGSILGPFWGSFWDVLDTKTEQLPKAEQQHSNSKAVAKQRQNSNGIAAEWRRNSSWTAAKQCQNNSGKNRATQDMQQAAM